MLLPKTYWRSIDVVFGTIIAFDEIKSFFITYEILVVWHIITLSDVHLGKEDSVV